MKNPSNNELLIHFYEERQDLARSKNEIKGNRKI
jgi:hypothetical protein